MGRWSARYQRYAEQCLDMAEKASPGARKQLLEMAEVWLGLAQAELGVATRVDVRQTAPSSKELQ